MINVKDVRMEDEGITSNCDKWQAFVLAVLDLRVLLLELSYLIRISTARCIYKRFVTELTRNMWQKAREDCIMRKFFNKY
jgi:hypothetical protein